jgi:hypothetical protein
VACPGAAGSSSSDSSGSSSSSGSAPGAGEQQQQEAQTPSSQQQMGGRRWLKTSPTTATGGGLIHALVSDAVGHGCVDTGSASKGCTGIHSKQWELGVCCPGCARLNTSEHEHGFLTVECHAVLRSAGVAAQMCRAAAAFSTACHTSSRSYRAVLRMLCCAVLCRRGGSGAQRRGDVFDRLTYSRGQSGGHNTRSHDRQQQHFGGRFGRGRGRGGGGRGRGGDFEGEPRWVGVLAVVCSQQPACVVVDQRMCYECRTICKALQCVTARSDTICQQHTVI